MLILTFLFMSYYIYNKFIKMSLNDNNSEIDSKCINKDNNKRENYIDWEDYFMAIAFFKCKT